MNKTTLGNTQSHHFDKIRSCFTYVEKLNGPLCCGVCIEYPYPSTNGVLHEITGCERIICKTCLNDTCPHCSQTLEKNVDKVPRYARNIFNSVRVKCNECDEGMHVALLLVLMC
eukprot:TRINITY_DN446_c1_g1_i6.p1 TRINITY_DN446_c1_g1~~TRINITY_DN446_c1_g1_i6.p1  ORF type:complete len:114 (-),score=17.19 TRINITY_DN446_c1_g1_i6:25-366(-)